MLYILSLILILIGVIKKESKVVFYSIWLLLLLLLGGNTENADRFAYMNNYVNIAYGVNNTNFEYGFQFLCKVGSFLGMSYEQFLFSIAFIGLALIASTIKLYTSNIAFALALYFIYPFIWDTVQIRNFLAMSIIIFGSRYIISYKKDYVKYIICVAIASSMHITALFYICALLVVIRNTRIIVYIVTIITASSIIVIPILLQYLLIFTTAEKIDVYTTTQTSLITKILAASYFLSSIILVKVSKNIIDKRNHEENEHNGRNLDLSPKCNKSKVLKIDTEVILQINIICVLSLYFVMNNLNFFRLYRNVFVLNYIMFAVSLEKMDKTNKYYTFYWCVLIFTMLSFLFLILYLPTTNIFNPIFDNNVIFP